MYDSLTATYAPSVGVALASIVVFALLVRWKRSSKSALKSLPLPPGPKRLPILGNLLQLPQVRPWEEYQKMSQVYGDIMYLEALGQPIILLNSLSRATEIYDKRAVTFSDRPYLPVLDIMEMNWSFGLMQYGPEWRKHRRPFHQLVSGSVLPKSYPIFNEEILVLLRKLRDAPCGFKGHIQHFFGAIIMRMSYGFDDTEKNKELIHDAEILMSAFADAALPGRYIVNNLPFLRYIPSWFPGAGWKRFCRYVATVNQKVLYDSFEDVKKDLRNGVRSAYPSMATTLLDEMPEEDAPERRELESIARISCASGYAAGADTTVSSATGLLLVLAMHPEVQKRAQIEVDSATGGKRLPLMGDREKLPYVNALVKELGRWYTVVPLGLAHVAAEDAEYDGYLIPKGTFVMTNSW
ncbi:cytochrome P450 [Coprinellus micaceus]|uniref:Cytochrome P450 n=1 Tax=Coprinellus micaceus TaxID=71717 RepID=A0A4Y7TIK9_COPMI|nr:cytochrome P450 [Coprinellus micaceus]